MLWPPIRPLQGGFVNLPCPSRRGASSFAVSIVRLDTRLPLQTFLCWHTSPTPDITGSLGAMTASSCRLGNQRPGGSLSRMVLGTAIVGLASRRSLRPVGRRRTRFAVEPGVGRAACGTARAAPKEPASPPRTPPGSARYEPSGEVGCGGLAGEASRVRSPHRGDLLAPASRHSVGSVRARLGGGPRCGTRGDTVGSWRFRSDQTTIAAADKPKSYGGPRR